MIVVQKSQLFELWKNLGMRDGQLVMCHAFLPALGRIEGGPETLIESLLEVLGPSGTFVAPTFTYSYRRGEIFDPLESRSQVGILGEVVRKHPTAVRSDDPLFSMAAIGHDAESLMCRSTKNCFGKGSIYAKLMDRECYFLLLGVDFTGLSLFMHLEKVNQVRYRYDVTLEGQSRLNGAIVSDYAVHFVRDEETGLDSFRSPIGDEIDRKMECRRAMLGTEHRFVPGRVVAETVREALQRDPLFLVKKNSKTN